VAATFPWLSTVANRFESYSFRKLSFVYETTKSASTNGSVMGVIDFDASEDPPSTKATMMAFSGATRSAVWQEFKYNSTGANLHKFARERYTRSTALAANLDVKTYDVGNFILGAAGCADTSSVGELYVEYTIELKTPQIALAVASTAPTEAQYVYNTTVSNTIFYGTSPNTFGAAYATAGVNTLTFLTAGTYVLVWEVADGAVSKVWTSITGTATVTQALIGYSVRAYVVVTAAVGETAILTGSGYGTSALQNMTMILPASGPAEHFLRQSIDGPKALLASQRRRRNNHHQTDSDSEAVYITADEMVDSCVLSPLEKNSGSWARVK